MALLACILLCFNCKKNVEISGNLSKWQPVILTFNGPELKEESATFRDYKLDVTFTNQDKSYTVPGYFAADGNAANTSANSGNKWRVIFTPDKIGKWSYKVAFKKGKDIAASADNLNGEALELDGETGSFYVSEIDANATGFYKKGDLRYVGERYLKYGETGEWFIKAGPGGPENFLGYAEFDNTYNVEGGVATDSMLGDNRLHEYEPHIKDWKVGDPTWQDGKGKGIIGSINYLASKGLNTLYMVNNNVNGDGRDCWPWVKYEDRDIYDVSKLDQWNIVLNHLNTKGLHIDFLIWEAENTKLLNGGDMGIERRIYYRELIARFGYLPGLRWNVSEEPQITPQQMLENVNYITQIEPYGKALGAECSYLPEKRDEEYNPLLGHKNFDGAWMQIHKDHHNEILKWLGRSEKSGHKWVVSIDESMAIYTDSTDEARQIFWNVLTAGGEGFDVYFGYGGGTCDIANEDFRNRDEIWSQLAIGIEFFHNENINPLLPKMKNHNELGNGKILALPGDTYIIYLNKEDAVLNLLEVSGQFNILWLNPVKNGDLHEGSIKQVSGGSEVNLGNPPSENDEWVVLVKKAP